jgi:hypothetical protein
MMHRAVTGFAAACLLVALVFPVGEACAKTKKKPSTAGEVKKKEKEEKPPGPSDERVNEGGQGRKNATQDAASSTEHPINERRP